MYSSFQKSHYEVEKLYPLLNSLKCVSNSLAIVIDTSKEIN